MLRAMRFRGLRFLAALAVVVFWAGSARLSARGATAPSCARSVAVDAASAAVVKSPPVIAEAEHFAVARRLLIENLGREGIRDKAVLAAMGRIQRQQFVPADRQDRAYADTALQIGHRQTISRPYIVALMTELVQPSPKKRALDIGTGSGYQAAVLGSLCKQVYSVEIVEPLANAARMRLAAMGYTNITVRCGDGYHGWPAFAPFDIIVVAAAPDHVPQPLIDQLAPGGRLVIPVGNDAQKLLLIEKDQRGFVHRRAIRPVTFVPMTGEAQKRQTR